LSNEQETPEFSAALLHPRFWPTWLLFGLWWLVVLLPYPFLVLLGRLLGGLFLLFGSERKAFARRNLELCFPELDEKARGKIMRDSFYSSGISFLEMGMAWWWPDWRVKNLCRVEGLEHIQNLNGQGAILLGMHFTTLDMGGAGFSLFQSYGSMYRSHDNPVFDLIQHRGRTRRKDLVIFPRGDLRTMVRLLKKGMPVWYAPDQDYGAERSVFVPFFGITAATITATGKLAQMGNAVALPFTHERLSWCRGYLIKVHPQVEGLPSGDDKQDATLANLAIEQCIRACPGQYLWAHRRFKSRPEGEPRLYPQKRSRRIKNARKEETRAMRKAEEEKLSE
jgi:KDO2-lipid IV(A) lauroyltransferase